MEKNSQRDYRGTVIYTVISAIIATAIGFSLNFLYSASGEHFIAALISRTNDSFWEELKILFMPFFALSILEYVAYGRKFGCFFTSKLFGVLIGMIALTASYYTYSGIIGKDFKLVNIALYVSAMFLSYGFAIIQILKNGKSIRPERTEILASFGFVILCALFFVLTFTHPNIAIFN